MPSQLAKASSIIARGTFDGLHSFTELEERISALGAVNTKVLGDAFEMFIEGLLATQPKFQVDENWVVGQVPLDVRQKMNLPPDAKGIDGIFRTRTGTLVPYQVKFRTGRPKLTYTEVAPFLGLTERAQDRIIFTNCNDVALDAKNRDAMRTVRGIDLDDLAPDDFAAIEAWLKERPVPIEKRTPRPYQQEAIDGICNTLAEHDRATAVMACGTGKTLVALWAVERMQPRSVLVLLPSLTLVQQTLDEWSRHNGWGDRFSYICVCSDKTVAKNDDIELHRMDVDFPVSTDPADVRSFLEQPSDGVKVVFSTYQSSPIVSEGARGLDPFDIAIFDEAHKTTGPQAGLFAHALFDSNIAIAKRLFLTATPRHYRIGKRDKDGNLLVVSMDDESVYGPRAYTLTFGEAARQGIICDYKVVISVVDGADIDQFLLQHGITLVEGEQIGAKWVASQIALEKAIEETSAKRAISFHSRVSMAEAFSSDTPRGISRYLEGFTTFHANGKQKSSERKQILKAFRDAPKALITNARCLTEGIDIPAVDMVAFVDPRRSKVDIAQAAGRAMRKPYNSDKTVGYVVVPLFVERDEGETFEEALKRTDYDEVIAVLNAMREQDDELVDIIQELKEAKGRGEVFNPRALAEKVQLLGPSVSLEALQSSIFAEVVESLGDSWDEWFGRLQAYKEEFGDCLVPYAYETSSGSKLGSWITTQRRTQDELSAERVERLDAIGFVWDARAAKWEESFQALQSYLRDHGSTLVPRGYQTRSGLDLGGWVIRQRVNRESLPIERLRKLQDIGFVWDARGDKWENGFKELEAYRDAHGDCLVPFDHQTSSGFKLFVWVNSQRQNYKKGKLSREKQQRLDELGFLWAPNEEAWEQGFGELKAYKEERGHCLVSNTHKTHSGYRLGQWATVQRQSLKKGSLSQNKRQRLDALGFVWDPNEEAWEAGYAALEAYKAENGDCSPPAGHKTPTGFKLGLWATNQRQFEKRGELIPERRERLKALGFIWKPKARGWERAFKELVAYKEEHGNCCVPVKYETATGSKLGNWVGNQKQLAKKGKLSDDRRKRLDDIGFVW